MRILDLMRLILNNLNRRKARVSLTAIGVVIGTAAVVILVSLAIGLQMNANEQLFGIGDLRMIQVSPSYELPLAQGEGGSSGFSPPQMKVLNHATLQEISSLPGVVEVIPREYLSVNAIMKSGKLEGYMSIIAIGVEDLSQLGLETTQGNLKMDKGSLVVGPMLANNMYDPSLRPGQPTPEPPELYGETLRIQFSKWDDQGTEIKKNITYKISGVLKENRTESDWSAYIRFEEGKAINEWASGRRINYNIDGYGMVIVIVDQVENVLGISNQITDMGLQAYTPQSYIQGINNFYIILQVIFGGVGAIALLVAAIGIANTMAMAILERTREIGLMKALGATNRDVLAIFLGEAAGIGFLGGVGGVLIGWVAGQAVNVVALIYLANRSAQQGGAPPSIAVYTPLWLPVFAMIFSTLIGLLSGLYPALRAATMQPVLALKYE